MSMLSQLINGFVHENRWENIFLHLVLSQSLSRCYYIHRSIATTFAVIRDKEKVNMPTTKTTNLCYRSKRAWVSKAQSANHNWFECKQTRSGGSKRKASVRTIRLTARRSFPHVFITASSCICLFKFDYRSSVSRLIDRSTPKTPKEKTKEEEEEEGKKKKEKRYKKKIKICACLAHEQPDRERQRYKDIHKRKADGCEGRGKDWGSYIAATTENNSFCTPFWCGTAKAHTRCFLSHSSSSSSSVASFFFVA